MNKIHTKAIEEATALMQQAHDLIDPIANELRERFDEKSEKAQEGEKGQELDAEATTLEGVRDNLSNDISELENLS